MDVDTERLTHRRRKASELAVIDRAYLAACITERDLTQRQVARLADCSHAFIAALVTGRKKGCRAETAQRISRALGRPTAELFTAGVAPRQRPRRPVLEG